MNLKFNYSFLTVSGFIGLSILSVVGMNKVFSTKYIPPAVSTNANPSPGDSISGTNTKYIPLPLTGEPAAPVDSISNSTAHTQYIPLPLPGESAVPIDSPKLKFPLHDINSSTDNPYNPIDLKTPPNIKDSISYDPETNEYEIIKTIGDQYYRDPEYMSFDDFLQYEYKNQQEDYFMDKSSSSNLLSRKGTIPAVNVNNLLLDRLFGGSNVDIRPQGNIALTFGANYTNIQNPSLTVQQRKQGGFNFDMNIQMNVIGKIGDKLKITTNYNTQAQFDFEKQVKLEYTGHADEIIKKIEAGNVSMTLPTQLITGSQSLFGLKTQLQFGRLKVTLLASQQKSQTQNITIQGGQQTQTFNIPCDQYDQNKNYFLAQYFNSQFNSNMAKAPTITTPYTITKVEIWVTNKTGATVNVREIDAFMDLGESKPYNHNIKGSNLILPFAYSQPSTLNSNSLYTTLNHSQAARSLNTSVGTLDAMGLVQGVDYEQTYARQLAPSEYTLNPQLGFIMLNTQLNPDDILAIAYQYTYNGQVYQVGEFAEDVPPNPSNANVLYLKLLKGTTINPKLPIWQLEMKNIYSLGGYGISQSNFILNVTYQDPAGGQRNYIPAAPINDVPLISVLGLDRFDAQGDPQPDGIFDFLPNITIVPQNGKIIFPELEPFGQYLTKAFAGNTANASTYVYQQLYDSTITIALEFPQYDRFSLVGQYQSSTSSTISLGAFNIPPGSVTVTAGGTTLTENVDYTIDYNLGQLRIINSAILSSGVPINVKFENNPAFVLTEKTLLASRFDYYINDNFKLGATIEHLSERPFTQKLNVGDDPISNTIDGIDGSYKTDAPWITTALNMLPFIKTKEKSSITTSAEGAALQPGHPKIIGKDGTVYIDDFEGTESTYDLKFPFTSWAIASTPSTPTGTKFSADSKLFNDLAYGFHRAKIWWYNIDPFFYTDLAPAGINNVTQQQYGVYTRQVFETDIFPTAPSLNQNGLPPVLTTFDIKYDPTTRGPFNYDYNKADFNPITGAFTDPTQNWGGIMRALQYTDFQAANIGFIEFWLLDPYLNGPPSGATGDLYIQIGNISEDILKDSRLFYENALPTNGTHVGLDSSVWSYFPSNGQPPIVPQAFDNNPASRQYQDVGYDGIPDSYERIRYGGGAGNLHYLDKLSGVVPAALLQQYMVDPSGDDYKYYRDPSYDAVNADIISRYENYNNSEGNSPITSASSTINFAETNIPETEDINQDNALNQIEAYYEYKFSLNPNDLTKTGQNFITDIVTTPAKDGNGNPLPSTPNMVWLQVRIPITSFENAVGGIADFTSIRWLRMFLTGFSQPIVLRFGELDLLRDQWREYAYSLQTPGEYLPNDHGNATYFNVTSVSYEADGQRTPINYVMPPGVQQQLAVGTVTNYLENESSLSEQICNLADGDARAAYKDINLDLRNYDSLEMFVHAESVIGNPALTYGEITAFIRLGSDFVDNYYEYELPLNITPPGSYNQSVGADLLKVWPAANNFPVKLTDLTNLKEKRDEANASVVLPYSIITANGARITIVGNPNLGQVKEAMLGVRNPKKGTATAGDIGDNGQPVCTEVWFDELRVSGFNESGGYAALAKMDVKLADLANINLSANMHTIGFGTLDSKVDQRDLDNFYQYNASMTTDLGRFLPKFIGLKLPMYIGLTNSYSSPKYDPYELDVTLSQRLSLIPAGRERDSVRQAAQTFTGIKSLNFTNVRLVSQKKGAKPHFYSPSNLSLNYAYSQTLNRSPTIQSSLATKHHLDLGYSYPGKSKPITPFSKLLAGKAGNYLKLIKDFNFNPLPTSFSIKTQFDDLNSEMLLRPVDPGDYVAPSYDNLFTNDRFYNLKWDFTKSLNFNFSATTNARIDEPYGQLDTKTARDSILTNLKDFGRTTHYHQNADLSYTVPINKLPFLDWTNLTAKYSASYDWLALPQVLDTEWTNSSHTEYTRIIQSANPLGNTLSNTQNISVSGDLNFRTLYNKWKWLKRYDTSNTPAKPKDKNAKTTDKQTTSKLKTKDAPPDPSFQAFLLRLLISLKKVNFSYTQTSGTVIPGFIYQPNVAGENIDRTAPGFNYIFGMQPDTNWLKRAASKGWISNDTSLDYYFVQTLNKNYNLKANFEPARDFTIDITFNETSAFNSNAMFKNTSADPSVNDFQLLSPQQSGTYSISYIALRTLFEPDNANYSVAFNNFSNYRQIISLRLRAMNPISASKPTDFYSITDSSYYQGYAYGYGPFSQDVLVPAFLAAYTGLNPNTVRLNNFFNIMPYPNWRISYNGLNKMEWAKKYVNNVSLTHAYSSTLSFGNYTNSLLWQGKTVNGNKIPEVIDSTSGNFIPYYSIQSVSISERFAPLLGIDISWKGGFTTKLEYGIGRNISLSTSNDQIAETRTSNVTFNFGYKWKKFPIPFKIRGKKRRLKNDVNTSLQLGYNKNQTDNYELIPDEPPVPTQGSTVIQISPAVDYQVNKTLTVRLFLDKRFTIPSTSATYPINYTSAGVKVTFTLQ